jgi:2-iminobutanoate/2-iminopropanoate deaminase
MSKQAIHTDHAPAAIGPYSQAIIANGFVFCAGQTPLDPSTMKLVEGDVGVQTAQAINNIKAILERAGTSLEHVVKTTVYLHSMADFQAMNAVYSQQFSGVPPARTTVGNLNLPLGCLVEIEAIAVLP